MPIDFGARPQNAQNSDQPGAYELVVRTTKVEVNPNDSTDVEVYVTGYGHIEGAKILFSPPPYFIDPAWVKVTYNIAVAPDGRMQFGVTESMFSEGGGILRLTGGVQVNGWPATSMFFDITDKPNDPAVIHMIATEQKFDKAPLEFSLQTHKKIPAGSHPLNFYLTYFNGQEWKTDSKTIQLTVPNWFKQHEAITWTIGIISFLITVGGALASLLK